MTEPSRVSATEEQAFRKRMQGIESLIQEVERYADPAAQTHTKAIVQALLDLHGVGLERILERAAQGGEAGFALIDALAADDLVGSLLLLYGLHPLDLETRVRQALDKVRPYLRSHGGNVELLSAREGVVRLRMQGSCHGCPSSAMTLKLAIEEAIYEKAPDVSSLEVEGVVEQPAGPPSTFVPVEQLLHSQGNAGTGGWEEIDGLASLVEGAVRMKEVGQRPVFFCRVAGTLYAYEGTCPGCGMKLDEARLEATTLVCAACGQRYDTVRAGRGLDDPDLHLEPFPLLVEPSRTTIALPVLR